MPIADDRNFDLTRRYWNFYEILSLPTPNEKHEVPTSQQVKTAYHRSLLKHHPDKHIPCINASGVAFKPSIDEIRLAYETLANPALRREYDKRLRTQHDRAKNSGPEGKLGNSTITELDVVDLDDMDYDEEARVFTRPCRCGTEEAFQISEDDLLTLDNDSACANTGEVLLACAGCSMHVKVLYNVADGG